ncbi:hypothetical protein ACHFCA_17345 [Delftia tsuruhatensis]
MLQECYSRGENKTGIGSFKSRSTEFAKTNACKSLYGQCHDRELSRKFGASAEVIGRLRRAEGIPTKRRYQNWSEKDVELLGTASDVEIAKILDCAPHHVWRARKKFGISRWESSGITNRSRGVRQEWLSRQWSDDEIKLFGTASDKEIAERLGCKKHHVFRARKKLGITGWKGGGAGGGALQSATLSVRGERDREKLGEKPDPEAGGEYALPALQVRKLSRSKGSPRFSAERPWKDEEVRLLGKVADAEVAKLTGRTKAAVTNERSRRAIPGINTSKARKILLDSMRAALLIKP